MTDVEPVIRVELERLAPQAETEWSDWNNVIGRTSVRPGLQRHRARRLALVAAVAFAVAAPAFALSSGVRSLLGFERAEPVLDQARLPDSIHEVPSRGASAGRYRSPRA